MVIALAEKRRATVTNLVLGSHTEQERMVYYPHNPREQSRALFTNAWITNSAGQVPCL